tara:strand:+ start:204 stop:530 length:327 start_codon:yes stop_codon:yes gene_type:complete
MIQEQQDIFFIEGNPQKGYKPEYANKIGVILPPNPSRGESEPTFLLNMLPQRQGKMVVLPRGQKPGQGMGQPQGGYQQNYNQGGPQHISSSMPMSDPADPGNSGQGYR